MLIFDIESRTFGKPNSAKDEFKFIGLYEFETGEYHFLSDIKEINDIFKRHRVIIGFNSKAYDEPIMKRAGLMKYKHLHIDLYEVVKKRSMILGCDDQSKSLANLAKFFGLGEDKGSFDYSLLQKESLSEEEYALLREYTLQDIKVTTKLFVYLSDYFEPFKEFLSKYDVRQYKWLTSSISVYAYKVICNLANIKEEYDDKTEHKAYPGGFVAEPSQATAHFDVYCLDFNSLYPHIMVQANLFGYKCKCCPEKYTGADLFKLQGGYCKKKLHPIGKVIHDIYIKRKELKKLGDRREQALKLVINTCYGLTGNPVFKNLYHYEAAYDCTLIARESCKLARKKFKDAGYEVLYSDTDSVFLKDVFKDKDRLMMVKDSIIKTLKQNLPFPVDTFDMGIDAEIKHIWFFKKGKSFLKKHYVYVTNDNKLTIKGLALIKRDSSRLGLLIFNKYMRSRVVNGELIFTYKEVSDWAKIEVQSSVSILARNFKVNEFESYKNPTQIQAQIAKVYGAGRHQLLSNTKYGVGLSVKYCTVEEFKEKKLGLKSLVLTKFWSEMDHFLNIPDPSTPSQQILDAWVAS